MTLELPPGLIANASLDGGACLTSATPLARLPGRHRHGHRGSKHACSARP